MEILQSSSKMTTMFLIFMATGFRKLNRYSIIALLAAYGCLHYWFMHEITTFQARQPLSYGDCSQCLGNKTGYNRMPSYSVSLPTLASCRQVKQLDCRAVIDGNLDATWLAKRWFIPAEWEITPAYVINLSSNCTRLVEVLGLTMSPMSKEEYDFPLAFAWLIYSMFHQFTMQLRRVYRPQNLYCVHVDVKSTAEFKAGVAALSKCLPNLVLAEKPIEVIWGEPDILVATRNCLQQLNDADHSWKYVQYLTGIGFPLRTNREMVEILKIYGGAADEDLFNADQFADRFQHPKIYNPSNRSDWRVNESVRFSIPPGHLTVYLGNNAVVVSREFVNFLFTNQVALDFYDWVLQTHFPDETYFATLIHNLHINPPGGFPATCLSYFNGYDRIRKPYMGRYQAWPNVSPCYGVMKRASCVFGVDDLPIVARKPHLQAHKFELDFEPAALYCLDELICNRTFGYDMPDAHFNNNEFAFDANFYEALPNVVYHKMEDKSKYVCSGFNVL